MQASKNIFLFLCLLIASSGVAQGEKCGTTTIMQQRMDTSAHYKAQVDALNKQILTLSLEGKTRNPGIITIPVVVHVLWKIPVQNISDEQILSQIEVLNEDFRRLNADADQTRDIFLPVAADTEIEFCLAQRDPLGNPTTGINRVQTNVTAFGADDAMKFSSFGGVDAWPSDQYLNIWVCNNWEVWGYAYFPGIEPEYDGVVCHYEAFGDTLEVVEPLNLGRTCTHEVGHWLGLYHTFDFGCTGETIQTCLGAGDRVCDTPGDDTITFGCDMASNTCFDSPVDFPDQSENFMDYSDDVCLNMFSIGQSERMNFMLQTFRQALLTSNACVPPGDPYYDAVALELSGPANGTCDFTPELRLRIGNAGNTLLNSLMVDTYFDGLPVGSIEWTGNLQPNDTASLVLTHSTSIYGLHTFSVRIKMPNGLADQNPENDSLSIDLDILSTEGGFDMPYFEGFEEGLLYPNGWSIWNPDQEYYWDLSAFYGGYLESSNSMIFENYWVNELARGRKDGLLSPVLDFSYVNEPHLSFDLAYPDPGSNYYSDTLGLYISLDCGISWSLLWRQGGVELSSAPTPIGYNNFEPNLSSEWRTVEMDLYDLSGQQHVQFMWENKTGWGYDLYLDNINLNGEVILSAAQEGPSSPISLYPNPSNGELNISGIAGTAQLDLFTTDGRHLHSCQINSNKPVSLSDYAPGLYFIRISNEAFQSIHRIFLDR